MSDARFGPAQLDAILQPAGICQSLLPPLASHRRPPSIQFNATQSVNVTRMLPHTVAFSSVKRPLFPAALSVPRVTGASIKDSRARIWHVGEPLLYTDFIFQLHFVAYSWTSPPGADFVFKIVVRRRDSTIAAFDYQPTTVTIDLGDGFIDSVIFQFEHFSKITSRRYPNSATADTRRKRIVLHFAKKKLHFRKC